MATIYEEYVLLNKQIQDLEIKKEELRNRCVEDMGKKKQKTFKFPFGTFSVVEKKSFDYSPEFVELKRSFETKLKDGLKSAEIALIDKYSDEHDKLIEIKRAEESDPKRLIINESLRFQE